MEMDLKKMFMASAQEQLTREVTEVFQNFFSPTTHEYVPQEGGVLYERKSAENSRFAIDQKTKVEMCAFAVMHVMAQQIALIIYHRPDLSRERLFQNTMENLKILVNQYKQEIDGGSSEGKIDVISK